MIRALTCALALVAIVGPARADHVVVDTDPSGFQVVIDGWFRTTPWTAPDDGSWAPGTQHVLRAINPIDVSPDTAWVFQSWSDGGEVEHTITVPADPVTYVASYELATRVSVRLETLPLDFQIRVDGSLVTAPITFLWLPGDTHTLDALDQNRGGVLWLFDTWSNGGSQVQDFVTGTEDEVLVATFATEEPGVLVDSEPQGLGVRIDGIGFTTPRFAPAATGQPVEIEAITPQPAGGDSSWSFLFWSDGGDTTHTVLAGADESVLATFVREADFVVEIGSNPPGLVVDVDGVTRTMPWTARWAPRTVHSLFAQSPQFAELGREWRWVSWSDGGAQTHDVVALADDQIEAVYELADLDGVLFDTEPTALILEIDGTPRVAPWFEAASPGTGLPVFAPTPQERDAQSVWAFQAWSDAGDTSHVVTVAPGLLEVTAAYVAEVKVSISVGTEPPGLEFEVDGTTYDTPVSFLWGRGTPHELSTFTPQFVSGATFDFETWSDGVALLSRPLTTPAIATDYRALFTLQPQPGTLLISEPAGVVIEVDGVAQITTPWFFPWEGGEQHTLWAVTPQSVDGTQFSFVQWGDGNFEPLRVWTQGAGTDTARALFAEDPSVYYTLATTPSGLALTADDIRFPTPVSLPWNPGSVHTLAADSLVDTSDQGRLRFDAWSDGGAREHTVTLPVTSQVYQASFVQQYLLVTIPDPIGSVFPPTGWQDVGAPVVLSAVPAPRGYFDGWEGTGVGSYTGPDNPVAITLGGPVTQVARFGTISYEFSLSLSDTDPEVHQSEPLGLGEVFLWFVCGTGEGLTAFDGAITGTMDVLGFTPLNGVFNAGGPGDLRLATPGCVNGPFLLGKFSVFDPGGRELCLTASPSAERLAASDCNFAPTHVYEFPSDMMIRGVATHGGAWCVAGRACGEAEGPIPVRLSGLEASAAGAAIEVRWRTSLEVDHAGFHVYRRLSPNGEQLRRTDELIRGTSPYSWRDESVEPGVTYRYEIGAVDFQGREVRYGPVEVKAGTWPAEFSVEAARPNPFRRRTSFHFAVPTERHVRCDVFDVTGRLVTTLMDARVEAGAHEVQWDGRDHRGAVTPGGVYFLRFQAGDRTRTGKIVRLPAD